MRVAIIHDWLNQYGGAERVLECLREMYPDAPIYTSIFWPQAMPDEYRSWDIRTSFLNRLPLIKRHHQPLLPLYPLAFEQFDLGGFDLVISNKSAFCHGVITPPEALHISYCLTPTRFIWRYHEYLQHEGVPVVIRPILPFLISYLRLWDRAAADRVDHFVAISKTVQQRVWKYYRRRSVVIYPPVNTQAFAPQDSHADYFLVVSRLIPYKRIDIVVGAFNQLRLPLLIVGDGRQRAALEASAESNIRFLGKLPDEALREHFAHCRALIWPGLEDFGIAPVEAQAAGRPVISYAGGGALDSVVDGVTGTFFEAQTPEALIEAVLRFDDSQYDPVTIRQHAARFDVSVFKEKLSSFIAEKLSEHRK